MSGGITGSARPSDDLVLVANGRAISGWTSVRVTRSLERMPASFDISHTDLDPGTPLNEGDAIEVRLGADRVITGWIDVVSRGFDHAGNSVTVTGRSKSQDLVDCAAQWPSCQIANCNALQIAQKLAEPYGVIVAGVGDPGPIIPTFVFALGERCLDIIERTLRYAGKLALDRADGSVEIGDVGTASMASGLAEGVNLHSARIVRRVDARFEEYSIFVQSVDVFEDLGDGGNLIAKEKDPNIKRPRKAFFISEQGDSGYAIAQKRIRWEASRRAGRGLQVRVSVDNWRDKAGKLWEPNKLAEVRLPSLKYQGQLLIAEVSYRLDPDRGTSADIVLMPPAAFTPQPVVLVPSPQLSERR